jgi:hypothetical protein
MPGYSASPCSRLSLLYVTVALEFIPTSLRRIWIVAFKHQASQQDSMCFCPVTFEILNEALSWCVTSQQNGQSSSNSLPIKVTNPTTILNFSRPK